MDTFVKKAHFMRRASFGGTLDELNSDSQNSQLLEQWLQEKPVISLPELGELEKGKQRGEQVLKFNQWLFKQMSLAQNPLQERMVNFWRDHFIVAIKKIGSPQLLTDYERRLREYALGDFRDLLWNVTTSPAMLSYLDNDQNRSGKINENYSREVMELFTIGRGQYSEKDISEGARALTGWTNKPTPQKDTFQSAFVPARHDNGAKTYLGQHGDLKTEDVVDILANHPSTAQNISRQLWSTFVYPNPEPAIVERLAAVYKNNNRNIKAVVEVIFTSPEFYSAKAYRSHLKNPVYFMLGTLRQLEIKADYGKVLSGLRAMGQVPYNAPTVKGWPEDSGWLTAPSLLTRLNLAQQMTQDYGNDGGFEYQPKSISVNELLRLLLDSHTESGLLDNAKGLTLREATALILSSPSYQLV